MILQDWLDSLENIQSQVDSPAPERCRIMLQRLDIAKWCPVVTVGGTNGKGSTVYCIAAYAESLGLKVGRFISPHLFKYNERIAINNQNVQDDQIIEAFEAIKAKQGSLYLNYFDYAFLAAMYLFHKAQINFLVLEVGLGGRLDATNSMDADCAIITTIDFDHTEILGQTREAISLEKAGIFRSGKIAICGDTDIPLSVVNYAKIIGARLEKRVEQLVGMPESHFPKQNALTALTALYALDRDGILPFNENKFYGVLENLHIPGRMQVLQNHPKVTVDVAHNPQGVRYLINKLEANVTSGRKIVVFSALMSKDISTMFQISKDFFDEWNLLQLDHPRAMPLSNMVKCITNKMSDRSRIHSFVTLEQLMGSLVKRLHRDDEIIIFGSFFIVGLFLKWYNVNKKSLEIL